MKICRSVTLVLIIVSASASARPAEVPVPKAVVYLGATLIDGTGAPPRTNVAIVTRGERITAVLPAEGFKAEAGQAVVDVRGKFIIPGLVNTHVHVATLANPAFAKAYLRRELFSGVTTVRDMAGDVRLLSELQREAEFGEIASPDIFYVALMSGPELFADSRTHSAARGRTAGQVPWMQAITPQTDLSLAVAEARGTGATAIKMIGGLDAALVAAVTREAHRQHLLVWAHAAVLPARPQEVVDAGVDVISHACLLGYQLSRPPLAYSAPPRLDAHQILQPSLEMDRLFADIKQRGIILDATLHNYHADPSATCPAGIADSLAHSAYRAGVAISAGTDDDPDWRDPDSALDIELSLLVDNAGMTPADAISSATLIGARAAGQEKDAGSIQVGKLANLVVLDRNPLENIANIRSVASVVKRGIAYSRADYKPASAEEMTEIKAR